MSRTDLDRLRELLEALFDASRASDDSDNLPVSAELRQALTDLPHLLLVTQRTEPTK